MRIAVLGAGPVGMVAAHAATLVGHHIVTIHGIKSKSPIRGAQYVHHPIDEITADDPEGTIRYDKVGTRDGYAYKIYKDVNAPCSWDRFQGEVPAWSMHAAYDKLWDLYSDNIFDQEIRYDDIQMLLDEYDLVFSSINPLGYCKFATTKKPSHHHAFHWEQIYTTKDDQDCPEQVIIYNGDPETPWYRTSNLFGEVATEYPGAQRQAAGSVRSVVRKPLSTTCDCHVGERFVRIGRYGEFSKNLLVTDAWDKALEVLDAL